MAVAKELVWTQWKSTYAGDADAVIQYTEVMWRIFYFITTIAGGVVVSSSNSVAASNNDSVNRWLTSANLIWANAGSAHSWVVIRFKERYMLIDLTNSTASNAYISFSDSKYYGGTTLNRPTSSRSVLFTSTATYACGQSAANRQFQFHGQYHSDGMRLFISYAGSTGTVLLWEYLTDVRGVHHPTLMAFKGNATSSLTIAVFNTSNTQACTSIAVTELALIPGGGWSNTIIKLAARDQKPDDYYNGWNIAIIAGTRIGDQRIVLDYDNASNEITVSVAFGGVLDATSEYMLHSRTLSTVPGLCYIEGAYSNLGLNMVAVTTSDDWDNTWPYASMRIISAVTGHRWCRGRVQDMYWGPSANANGQLFDTDLTRDWVQYGNFVIPNDGTVCPVT